MKCNVDLLQVPFFLLGVKVMVLNTTFNKISVELYHGSQFYI